MATANYGLFNGALQEILKNTIDLDGDTIKLALVTSSYTFNADHDEWADCSGAEVATGNGYTTGGATLANKAVTYSSNVTKFDADDVVFSSLTKTFRYGIIYANVTRNGKTNPLIAWILFDNTPADVSSAGSNYTVQFAAAGAFTLTKPA